MGCWSATITDFGNCTFKVTYTWSGFSGTGLEAELALGYKGFGGANVFIAWMRVPNQDGNGAGLLFCTSRSTPFRKDGRSA